MDVVQSETTVGVASESWDRVAESEVEVALLGALSALDSVRPLLPTVGTDAFEAAYPDLFLMRQHLRHPCSRAMRRSLFDRLPALVTKLEVLFDECICASEQHSVEVLKRLKDQGGLRSGDISNFLGRLVAPGASLKTLRDEFERLPEVQGEIRAARINSTSHVLVIGCGALSLSGIGYALAGARVTLVDHNQQMVSALNDFLKLLPSELSTRITTLHRDGAEPSLWSGEVSHVFLAAMVRSKELFIPLLNLFFRQSTAGRGARTAIIRNPIENLFSIGYGPFDTLDTLCASLVEVVDPMDQTSLSLILRAD